MRVEPHSACHRIGIAQTKFWSEQFGRFQRFKQSGSNVFTAKSAQRFDLLEKIARTHKSLKSHDSPSGNMATGYISPTAFLCMRLNPSLKIANRDILILPETRRAWR